jgi:hypothetical protein
MSERVAVQAKTGRTARTNPSHERIYPYLERDLTIVVERGLSLQPKVKATIVCSLFWPRCRSSRISIAYALLEISSRYLARPH